MLLALTSESRRNRELRPFPQESVGGSRKDEVQWRMFSALSSTPLPSPLSLVLSEKDIVGWC